MDVQYACRHVVFGKDSIRDGGDYGKERRDESPSGKTPPRHRDEIPIHTAIKFAALSAPKR
jgi:hypothetical protein